MAHLQLVDEDGCPGDLAGLFPDSGDRGAAILDPDLVPPGGLGSVLEKVDGNARLVGRRLVAKQYPTACHPGLDHEDVDVLLAGEDGLELPHDPVRFLQIRAIGRADADGRLVRLGVRVALLAVGTLVKCA